jgi:hypothetical protein
METFDTNCLFSPGEIIMMILVNYGKCIIYFVFYRFISKYLCDRVQHRSALLCMPFIPAKSSKTSYYLQIPDIVFRQNFRFQRRDV